MKISRLRELAKKQGFYSNRPLSESSNEDNYIYCCLLNRWLIESYQISVSVDNDDVGYNWETRDHYRRVVPLFSDSYCTRYDSAFVEGLMETIKYINKKNYDKGR